MRIATSDKSSLTYMLNSELLNVLSLEKDLGRALRWTINLNFTSTPIASKMEYILPDFGHH